MNVQGKTLLMLEIEGEPTSDTSPSSSKLEADLEVARHCPCHLDLHRQLPACRDHGEERRENEKGQNDVAMGFHQPLPGGPTWVSLTHKIKKWVRSVWNTKERPDELSKGALASNKPVRRVRGKCQVNGSRSFNKGKGRFYS